MNGGRPEILIIMNKRINLIVKLMHEVISENDLCVITKLIIATESE